MLFLSKEERTKNNGKSLRMKEMLRAFNTTERLKKMQTMEKKRYGQRRSAITQPDNSKVSTNEVRGQVLKY